MLAISPGMSIIYTANANGGGLSLQFLLYQQALFKAVTVLQKRQGCISLNSAPSL